MRLQQIVLTLLMSAFVFGCSSKSKNSGDGPDYQVSQLDSGYEFYSADDLFLVGPQPSAEDLKSMKADADVDIIINVRGLKENRKVNFDPKVEAKSVGIKYYQIPLMKRGAPNEAAISKIEKLVKKNSGKKILIYCSSGNRAAAWYGIQKARDGEMSTMEAVRHASNMGLNNRKLKGVLTAYLASSGLTVSGGDMLDGAAEQGQEVVSEMEKGAEEAIVEEGGDVMENMDEPIEEDMEPLE